MIKLIRRNLLRNKRRTFLTMASLAMALFILSLLGVVNDAMSFADESAIPDRLVVRNAISLTFPLPEAYEQRLRTIDNVTAVTPQNWFQGVYRDQRPENFFPRFTVDPETFRSVFYDYTWNEEEWEAFAAQRTAFAAGRELTEIQGWSLGDTIAIKGDIFPIDVELQLRAISISTSRARSGRSSSTVATSRRRWATPARTARTGCGSTTRRRRPR